MGKLIRFGVSIEEALLKKFDELILRRKYANRSEAIRDLMRKELVELDWQRDKADVVGAVALVYDHHVRELSERLNSIQHEHAKFIITSLHVHLDEHNCLEIVIVRGKPRRVRAIADFLVGMKGVKHGSLLMTTTGKHLV